MRIATVTVIGANGTMGQNVSGIFASFGQAKVYMVCRNIDKAKVAADRAALSVKADSIRERLVPVNFDSLIDCVKESDLIFESVAEDESIKSEVIRKVGLALQEGTVFCSGSSGLSITKLAEALPENRRGNYFGVHMFNPPYSLTLCELSSTVYSNKNTYQHLKQYLASTLRRTVVEVKDSPAFLGNRIGFEFLNEAMQYAQLFRHSGGIDYIDSILGPFTGRSMPPLVTIDFVGLDIHKAIVENLFSNLDGRHKDTFKLPEFAERLIESGKLGRKTNGGLYMTQVLKNGVKERLVYDIAEGTYREKIKYNFSFVERMVADFAQGDYQSAAMHLVRNESTEAEICTEFLLKYILNSLHSSLEVGHSTHDADDVMANGFNWCPPQALLEWLSGTSRLYELIHERLPWDFKETLDIEMLLKTAQKSKYDYRRYLLAKK